MITFGAVEQAEESTQAGERNVENIVKNETTQDIEINEEELQQDPPTQESSSFPYTQIAANDNYGVVLAA